jgi:hypothetical protein
MSAEGAMQAMAAALPQLRALHLTLPAAVEDMEAEDRCRCLQHWLVDISEFTQIQQLTLTVPNCCIESGSNLQPAVPQEYKVREQCKLQQLQQLTLQGWVWEVSAELVVGLEVGLPQLSSIRLEGCGGYGQEVAAKKAELRESMQRAAAGLRPGLQLEYVS